MPAGMGHLADGVCDDVHTTRLYTALRCALNSALHALKLAISVLQTFKVQGAGLASLGIAVKRARRLHAPAFETCTIRRCIIDLS